MRHKNRGFSLIEILVAFLVLGSGLLGLARLQVVMANNVSVGKQRLEAVMLAQQKIEEFRSYVKEDDFNAFFAGNPSVSGSSSVTGESASYAVSWSLTDSDSLPNSDKKGRYADITVRVQWADQKGETHATELKSAFAKLARPTVLVGGDNGGNAVCEPVPSVSWTVNGTNCSGAIPGQGQVGEDYVVNATINAGKQKFSCTAGGVWSEAPAYADKSCTAICPAQAVTWSGPNNEACVSSVAASSYGSTVNVQDSTAPVKGGASFACGAGTWSQSGTPTCAATCLTKTDSWGNLSQCQGKTVEETTSINTRVLNFSADTITATATYRCEINGVWSLQANVCADSATPTQCTSTVLAWTQNGNACSATAPNTALGQTITLTKPDGSTIGSANFACQNNGTWNTTAQNPVCTNNCFVSFSGDLEASTDQIQYRTNADSSYSNMPAGSCTLSNKSYICNSFPAVVGATYTLRALKNGSANSTKNPTFTVSSCGQSFSDKDMVD